MHFNRTRNIAPSYQIEKISAANNNINVNLLSPYEYTITFLNGFRESVTIVERNGLKHVLPPQYDKSNINFIIRKTYRVPREIYFDADNQLNRDPDLTVELTAIAKHGNGVIGIDRNHFHESKSFSIDYTITKDMLHQKGDSLYLMEHDIVISTKPSDVIPLHPFSKNYIKERLLEENKEIVNEMGFGLNIRIVDNNGVYGDRYINFNGKAYRIPARKDSTLSNGVYHTTISEAFGDYESVKPEILEYNFNDADKALKLFRTIEEALTYGDPIKARADELELAKQEAKEREHSLKIKINEQEAELKKNQIEHAEYISKLENMRKEIEHYRIIDKFQRNDYYEQRSQNRKDWTEVLKYIPAIIMGVGAAYMAWQKIKNPS